MSTSIKIRFLGSWWDAPEGDFPVRAIAARLRELRDAEVIKVSDSCSVIALQLFEDSVNYGVGIFVISKDRAFMLLLEGTEDWEALKEFVKERYGGIETEKLVEVLASIAKRESGIVELS